MILVYMFASLVGASATVAALWPSGWLLALLCAPLGASAVTLAFAVSVAVVRGSRPASSAGVSVQA